MKARAVEGLDPAGPLADQAERIVATRLDELESFVPRAFDPAQVRALHDMRIAAKRLRYVLEATADACFGPYAAEAVRRVRDLQDLLGDLHDCDVLGPRVRLLLAEATAQDAAATRRRAAGGADLDPRMLHGLPHARARRGLGTLEVYVQARRDHLFERFLLLWRDLEREGFAARLRYAIMERPA